MALFDGDMVTVTTPDGRRVQMPAGLATSFPQLQPVPVGPPPGMAPPPIPPAPEPPQFSPDQQTQIAAAANSPPTDAPVVRPAQVPLDQPAVQSVPRGPVTATGEAADPGMPNPPRPLTNDQLAKMGNAGVYDQGKQGLDDERTAIRREGTAMADQATQVGDKMAAVEAEAGRQLEARRAAAEANAKAIQDKTEEYLRRAQQIADTKIDRTSDHPVLSAIGMMLTTMGASMAGRDPSIAVKSFYEAIDRKVAAQMQDLEAQRQGLAVQKEGIVLTRQAGMDRLGEMDTYRLGYLEQAKRQIATIQQKTQSQIILAQTDKASAMITQKQNEILGGAVQREQQKREQEAARAQAAQLHRESLALQRRGQNMEQERFLLNFAEQRQEKADALAEKMMQRGDAAAAARAKDLGEVGMVDPSTGDFILSQAGVQKMAQADQLEAAARKVKDPAQAKKMAEQAEMLRQSALTNDAASAKNKKSAEEAQKALGTTQNLVNNVNAARQMLEAGPEAFNRESFAAIKIALENVKINYAQSIGERLSVRALEAFDDVLSVDTDSVWSRTFDKGKAIKALGTLETEMTQAASVALKNAGVKTPWRPGKPTPAAEFSGQTADEVGKGAEPSAFKKYVVNPIAHPIDITRDIDQSGLATDQANLRTNPKGQASKYGLDPKDDDKVRELIGRAGSAGNAEYDRIVSQLAAPLIAEADKRPSLVRGIANLLRDDSPKLLEDVMAKVSGSGGQIAADRVGSMLQQPVDRTPASELTPGARAQLEEAKVRMKFNVPKPQDMPPMVGAPPVPGPQLPPFVAAMPPDARQAYLNYLRSNGIDVGGAQ